MYLRCDENVTTLYAFHNGVRFVASDGRNGAGGLKHGKNGEDIVVVVPVGTEVWSCVSGSRMLADLRLHGETVLVARAGSGGRGNAKFASATNRFPVLAEDGGPGDEVKLRLELKLLADVGIVGAPNVGKSSLLAAVSKARPRIAEYPFTTIEPVLGVVQLRDTSFVMVDIPGLIEGAHQGVGLGDEFLKHMERTKVLLHMLDGTCSDPVGQYLEVRREMELFSSDLLDKPEVIAVNKADVCGVEASYRLVRDRLGSDSRPVHCISAAARLGLDGLIRDVLGMVSRSRVATKVGRNGGDSNILPVLEPKRPSTLDVVRKENSGYVVCLRSATRLASMVDSGNWNARVQMHEQLRRLGVLSALRKAGIRPGEVYRVGKLEWEWL